VNLPGYKHRLSADRPFTSHLIWEGTREIAPHQVTDSCVRCRKIWISLPLFRLSISTTKSQPISALLSRPGTRIVFSMNDINMCQFHLASVSHRGGRVNRVALPTPHSVEGGIGSGTTARHVRSRTIERPCRGRGSGHDGMQPVKPRKGGGRIRR